MVIKSEHETVLAPPTFKATGRQPKTSFNRNIQQLLESTIARSSPADESGTGAGSSAMETQEASANQATARQLRRLDSILAGVQDLRRSISNGTGEATPNLTSLETIVKRIFTQTDKTEYAVNEIDTRTECMNEDLQTLSETVDKVDNTIDEIETRTDSMNDDLETLTETVDRIEETTNKVDNAIEEIDTRTDSMNDDLQTLSDVVNGVEDTVNTTATEVLTVGEEIAQCRSDVAVFYQALHQSIIVMDRKLNRVVQMVEYANGY